MFEKPEGHDPLRPALQWRHIPGAWGEGLSLVDVLSPLGMALAGRYGELTSINWETDDLLSSVPYLSLRARCEGQCRCVISKRWAYVPRRHYQGHAGFVRLAIFNLCKYMGFGQAGGTTSCRPTTVNLSTSVLKPDCHSTGFGENA